MTTGFRGYSKLTTRFMFWGVAALLVLYVAAVLSIQMLPTQDGPAQLYYINVFRLLMTGSAPYASYYAIGRMIGSHVFSFYLIAPLTAFLSPATAEKLFVALYVVWTVAAFRYLVRALSPSADMLTSVLIFPFILNSVVYLGFFDFYISVPTTLFACGYWLRNYQQLTLRRWIAAWFLASIILIMHLAGGVVFLGFVGVTSVIALLTEFSALSGGFGSRLRDSVLKLWKPLLYMLITGLMGLLAVVYTQQRPDRHLPVHRTGIVERVREMVAMRPTSQYESRAYRILLGISLAIAAALFLAGLIRAFWSGFVAPAVWALGSITTLCAIGYFLVPDALSDGQAYLPVRFAIFISFFIVAGAALYPLRGVLQAVAGATAAVVAVLIIAFQISTNQRLLVRVSPLLSTSSAPGAKLGAIVNEGPVDYDIAFSPEMWVGLNYLQRSGVPALNNPWMGPHAWLSVTPIQSCQIQDPRPMADCLLDLAPKDRPPIDLLVDLRAVPSSPEKGRKIAAAYGLTSEIFAFSTISIYTKPEIAALRK